MAQTYKLRLSDGTMLMVDYQGLRTWTADDEAMVQSSGWRGWRLLREVIAEAERPPQPGDGIAVIKLKQPPPALRELPSLRLAEEPQDEIDGDVYDGDMYDEPGVISITWLWMKRLVLIGALGVGAFFAFLTWETWLPKAGEFGRLVLAQIESRTQSPSTPAPTLEEAEQQQMREALSAATEQIPYLSSETVQQVMASSVTGLLDPPEVFRRAHEATERGVTSLGAQDSQELKALRRDLMAALSTADRQRVQEYDLARGVRVTMPFEDRAVLQAYVRGAQALPPASRERLSTLSAKAIAAGLGSSAERSSKLATR
jgi:hypothetical protein